LIHQPSYSLFNRHPEPELIEAVGELSIGCICFSPLAQGMLTDRYLDGIPEGSRASVGHFLKAEQLTTSRMDRVRALADIAARRGQSLAALALAWVLRDPRMTSTVIGASSVAQLETNLKALENRAFSAEELAEIDRYAVAPGTDIWSLPGE
ncbi:MAG TPA: aldo/keto reductase, partial [Pseudonocardiaceae bacterium]|nr:aldo/keto reductase [Pseudonocardiaceae bacterium]